MTSLASYDLVLYGARVKKELWCARMEFVVRSGYRVRDSVDNMA